MITTYVAVVMAIGQAAPAKPLSIENAFAALVGGAPEVREYSISKSYVDRETYSLTLATRSPAPSWRGSYTVEKGVGSIRLDRSRARKLPRVSATMLERSFALLRRQGALSFPTSVRIGSRIVTYDYSDSTPDKGINILFERDGSMRRLF